MNVAEYEQAFARICMDRQVAEADIEALGGDSSRWMLYRRMVRKRLIRMTKDSLPRTVELMGEELYGRAFEDFMAERGPRSRYVRDVTLEFEDYLGDWIPRSAAELPDALPDLARYEATIWEVKDIEGVIPEAAEFDFDARPMLNPLHRVLRVDHPVHSRAKIDSGRYEPGPARLVVFRKPNDRVATIALSDWASALIELWACGDRSATESVQALGEAGIVGVDEAFIGQLCDVLALWIERGLVLGSYDS